MMIYYNVGSCGMFACVCVNRYNKNFELPVLADNHVG